MANVYVPFPKCKLKVMVKVTMTNNNYLRAPTFSVGVPYITRAFGLTLYAVAVKYKLKRFRVNCFFSCTSFTKEFQYHWYMLQITAKDGRLDYEVETIYWKDAFVKQ